MTSASSSDTFPRWGLDELLLSQPGLRIVPAVSGLVLAGTLEVNAQISGKAAITDKYQIELRIPQNFPKEIPSVFETGGRIPRSYHRLKDGSLCLGSPTKLRLILAESPSILRFVKRCLIPYLYGYSYRTQHGVSPFGELEHGSAGIRQDLMPLFGVDREAAVLGFVELAAMKKRHANKKPCPCGSGLRLGRCHNRKVNWLRNRLGRYWFRLVRLQLIQEELPRLDRLTRVA
jgi:hypothetical protein